MKSGRFSPSSGGYAYEFIISSKVDVLPLMRVLPWTWVWNRRSLYARLFFPPNDGDVSIIVMANGFSAIVLGPCIVSASKSFVIYIN